MDSQYEDISSYNVHVGSHLHHVYLHLYPTLAVLDTSGGMVHVRPLQTINICSIMLDVQCRWGLDLVDSHFIKLKYTNQFQQEVILQTLPKYAGYELMKLP